MERLELYLAAGYYVLRDWTIGSLRSVGFPLRPLGNRISKISADSAVRNHEEIYAVYRRYLRGRRPARVCEIGPGDSLGTGILFFSDGAESVTFVDRFSIQPPATEKEVWAELFRRHAAALAPRFGSPKAVRAAIEVVDDVFAEKFFTETGVRFDFICSNAVLEHLDDPLLALTRMYDALAPGGVMVHIVDLRNHGLFIRYDPLFWLETPTWLHRKFRRHSAKPNRVMLHAYKLWARDRSGVEFFVRELVGMGRDFGGAREVDLPPEDLAGACDRIACRRHKFAKPHCDEPVTDLAVSVFILVVSKPIKESNLA